MIPQSNCRRCNARLNDAIGSEVEAYPEPQDVSICAYCGTVSFFDDELKLREPTAEEVNMLLDDPMIERELVCMYARLVDANDERMVFPCGCQCTTGVGLFTLEACSAMCLASHMMIRLAKEIGKPLTLDPQLKEAGFDYGSR